MMRSLVALVAVFLAGGGWGRESAQPPLPTITLTINAATVVAEVADTDEARSAGLMFREALADDAGMLFVMPGVGPAAFYMKNTGIPLSIAFIGPQGTILEIHDLEPFNEIPVRSRFQTIAYALEMPRGWFSERGIFPGIVVRGLPPVSAP
jgi:uncharacterized protein